MKFCVLSALCLFYSLMALGQQTTIRVPGDVSTIQGAIDAARDGDVVLVAPGTYKENLDFKGKVVTVTSGAKSSADAASTIIQPAAVAPTVVFKTNETAASVLNGFTIENGNTAAVYLPNASATITNNVITQNNGCALVISGATSSPLIQGNTVSETNGSTQCNGFPEVGTVGYPRSGVGINVLGAGDVRIIGNLVEKNGIADCGAGLLLNTATKVLLQNNTIRNNRTSGGGCAAGISAQNISDLFLIQNLVYGNISSPATGHTTSGVGGILLAIDRLSYSGPASLTMVGNTVYGNRQYFGGPPLSGYGEQAILGGAFTSVKVENNLFISDNEYQALACLAGLPTNTDISFNDVFNAGAVLATNCVGNGVTNNMGVDPLFLNPTSFDFHTQSTSPVVAAGDINAPQIPPQDLDSKTRTVCGTIDMGVYEFHPHPPITLQSSANPVSGGSSVTFSARVNGNCNVPTGSVTFLDGANTLATEVLNSSASATFTTSSLTVGTHPITVTYPGDINFSDGGSNTVSQVMTGYPSQTALSAAPNSGRAFQALKLTAGVTSAFGAPDGSVTFSADGQAVATASLNLSGIASATTNALGAGTHRIIATYNASTRFAGSTSHPTTVTLVGADTTTVLSLSPISIAPGQTVTLTAHVSATEETRAPTGTVTFVAGTTVLGTAAVGPNGGASLSLSTLVTGTYPIRASYGGDSDFNSSASGVSNLSVTAIPTNLGLSVSPNPATVGQKVTLIATAVAGSTNQPPTGSVTFSDENGVLGTSSLVLGVASFSISTLSVGTHQLVATFTPTGPYGGSVSSPVSETITNASFTLGVSPSSLPIPSGDYQYVEVTVSPTGGFTHAVNLDCSSLPDYSECSFSSNQTKPLGNGAQTLRLMVNTSDVLGYGNQVAGTSSAPLGKRSGLRLFAASFLFPVFLTFRKKMRFKTPTAIAIVGFVTLALAELLTGCGGKLPSSTAPGNYVFTVTAIEVGSSSPITQATSIHLSITAR